MQNVPISNFPNQNSSSQNLTPAADALGAFSEKVGHTVEIAKEKLVHGAEVLGAKSEEVRAKVHDGMESARAKVHEGIEGAKEQIHATGETVSKLFGDFAGTATDFTDRVGGYVRANPGKSVAIAVVAGIILSRAMGSRRS